MKRRILVTTAAQKVGATNSAKQVDVSGGDATFTAGLVPDDGTTYAQPTHYWANWQFDDDEYAQYDTAFVDLLGSGAVKAFDTAEYTPDQVLAELGLKRFDEGED